VRLHSADLSSYRAQRNCVTSTIGKLVLHIVYSNSVVAIATGVLCASFTYTLQIETWLYYGFFAFFATFTVYNGQRLIKSAQPTETPWLVWVKRNEKLLLFGIVLAILGTLGSLIFIAKISFAAAAWLGISGIISFFYVVRVKGVNMREIAYLKIHLIAFSWVTVLILFPALNEGLFSESLVWITLAHYLYIIAVTIPFDIRDLKFDKGSQMTIPQVVGQGWAKVSSIGLLLIFTGLMIWQIPELQYNWMFYLAVAVQALLALFMNEQKGDIYCAGGIDGAITLLGISYFLI
jgi:hypothetical protein